MPDTFQSGAYQVTAWIEQQYVPTAFKPTEPDNQSGKNQTQNKTIEENTSKGSAINTTTDKNQSCLNCNSNNQVSEKNKTEQQDNNQSSQTTTEKNKTTDTSQNTNTQTNQNTGGSQTNISTTYIIVNPSTPNA